MKLSPEENHRQYGVEGAKPALNTFPDQPAGCWDMAKGEGGKGEGVTAVCLCSICSWLLQLSFAVDHKLQKGFACPNFYQGPACF